MTTNVPLDAEKEIPNSGCIWRKPLIDLTVLRPTSLPRIGNKNIRLMNETWVSKIASIKCRIDLHLAYRALKTTIANETESLKCRPSLVFCNLNESGETDAYLTLGSTTNLVYHSGEDISLSSAYNSNVQPSTLRCPLRENKRTTASRQFP